jgi:hypothetical protein
MTPYLFLNILKLVWNILGIRCPSTLLHFLCDDKVQDINNNIIIINSV